MTDEEREDYLGDLLSRALPEGTFEGRDSHPDLVQSVLFDATSELWLRGVDLPDEWRKLVKIRCVISDDYAMKRVRRMKKQQLLDLCGWKV